MQDKSTALLILFIIAFYNYYSKQNIPQQQYQQQQNFLPNQQPPLPINYLIQDILQNRPIPVNFGCHFKVGCWKTKGRP